MFYFCTILIKVGMCWWYFVTIPNQKCHENSFGWKSVVPCGQKDMMRLTVSLIILPLRLKTYQHPKACIRSIWPGTGGIWWSRMNRRAPQKLGHFSGWVHNKLGGGGTETKQKLSVSWQICNSSATFIKLLLQLVCVFCNSTESRRRSIKIKRFLFCCNFH